MATQAWSTRMRHDSDVFFREWGSELSAKLTAAGLVQTADTGQINWITVVRGASPSDSGYEIYKLNDALVTSAPVFFRIDYGTGTSGTSSPRIRITVGTSTDGAGVLGGTALSAANLIGNYNGTMTSDTARVSYLCVTEGFFGLNHKINPGSGGEGCFLFSRTVNSSGVPTVTGSLVIWGAGQTEFQSFRYAATAAAYTLRASPTLAEVCLFPNTPTSSLVGANNQAYLVWTITPQVAPLLSVCGVVISEVGLGSTFSATLVGTTPHTYIGLDTEYSIEGSNGLRPVMLWE